MQKSLFDSMSISETVQFLGDMAKVGLPPNKKALARLYELERAGEDVRSRLSNLYDEKITREYEKHKAGEKEVKQKPEAELDRTASKELYFHELWILHLRYVPIFTMLHAANQKETADAYRAWLHVHHG